MPTTWNIIPAPQFVHFTGAIGSQPPSTTVPRLAVDVNLDEGDVGVAYAFPRAKNYAGCSIEKLHGNHPVLQEEPYGSFLELTYYVGFDPDTNLVTIYTPTKRCPKNVPPGWGTLTPSKKHVYNDGDNRPGLPDAPAVRIMMEATYAAGVGNLTVGSVGSTALQEPNGGEVYSSRDVSLGTIVTDFDGHVRIVYRIYRSSVPTVSVTVITP
jgi:hypothetical protein